jgi:2-polyprenyl-6-hydroxyphenyl methylase/3-demethylubiquinone-9 3-methyltransferase
MVSRSTVDQAEVDQFARLATKWWDPQGPMAALHKFNPVRLAYIRDRACERFGRDPKRLDSLSGLRILDIGCGGGILCEPLARLGAEMVGADPSDQNIAAAREHAARSGVAVDYRCTTAEALADAGERFDIVLAMEVVEHVTDRTGFVGTCGRLVRPGGLFFGSTINRTLRALAFAIVGAEYVLRWVPRGTHQWSKLVTPEEFRSDLRAAGLEPGEEAGIVFDPFGNGWRRSRDTAVNYMLIAKKPAG